MEPYLSNIFKNGGFLVWMVLMLGSCQRAYQDMGVTQCPAPIPSYSPSSIANPQLDWVVLHQSTDFTLNSQHQKTLFKVSGSHILTLPPTDSLPSGFYFSVLKTDSKTQTFLIRSQNADRIDGMTSIELTEQGSSITLVNAGARRWYILDRSIPKFQNLILFNIPGIFTYTVPTGVKQLRAKVFGAGGGGAFSTVASGVAAGGGGGAFCERTISNPGNNSYTVVVGAGGAGGSVGAGSNGGLSSFDGTCVAGGGEGGNGIIGGEGGIPSGLIHDVLYYGGTAGMALGALSTGGASGAGSLGPGQASLASSSNGAPGSSGYPGGGILSSNLPSSSSLSEWSLESGGGGGGGSLSAGLTINAGPGGFPGSGGGGGYGVTSGGSGAPGAVVIQF